MFRVLLTVGLVALGVHEARGLEGRDWRYSDIVKLIEARKKEKRPFQSVEELLAALPPGLKSDFTFVFDSKNKFQAASPTHPRALVFNENLVYSFNGHPGQRGFDTLEFLELDEAGKKMELREIVFEKVGDKIEAKVGKTTPAKCLQCHGANPRPMWAPYKTWPGVYGADNDDVGPSELENYRKFQEAFAASPMTSRYAKLTYPTASTVSPYSEPGRSYGHGYAFRPNLVLTKLLVRFNAIRLMGIASRSPYYDRLKWILPGVSGVLCGVPDDLRQQLTERLDEALAQSGFRVRTGASLLDKAMRLVDLPPHRYSMESGATGYYYEDGSSDQLTQFISALAVEMARTDSELASQISITERPHSDRYSAYALYRRVDALSSSVLQRGCTHVHVKMAQSIATPFPKPVAKDETGEQFVSQLRRAEERRVSGAIPISCVFCHTISHDGPRISFDDEGSLRRELREDNGRLLSSILERLHPTAPSMRKMPPPNAEEFAPLSPSEIEAFTIYLRGL